MSCDLKLDLFLTQGGRAGQCRDQVERTPELFRGFDQRRALRRPLPRFTPQPRCFLDLPGLGPVTRQQLGLVLSDLRRADFRGFRRFWHEARVLARAAACYRLRPASVHA